MRVAHLGPAGTFSEDALHAATAGAAIEALPMPTIYDAITAVDEGRAERALVPFENSIEGSVRATLDALTFDAPSVTIVGEHDQPISNSLIARRELELGRIEVVVSHPQASAQCARFIRAELPAAEVRAAPSTAEAVREVAGRDEPWAALGYGGADLQLRRPARGSKTTPATSRGSSGWLRRESRRGDRGRGRPPSASPSSAPITRGRSWRR
jgi:prephenate dehydratase